jgi:excisionase family DNA binding protein
MLVNVQRAARRLGVSPVTIRRWTASGFLPCTRTPGGHRRIATEDLDEIANAIGESNHLAARLARERELDTVVSTAIALSSRLELPALLDEITRRITRVLGCQFCAISEYDPATDALYVLADYDHTGGRVTDSGPYLLRDYPLTRRVIEEQTHAVVNVDDPSADPAEVAQLRRDGGCSLLMVPLVYKDRTIGLLEVVDHARPRRYTRQEVRLARAITGHAAVALMNARAFEQSRAGDTHLAQLRESIVRLAAAVPALASESTLAAFLSRLAEATRAAFGAASCVAETRGVSAGAAAAVTPPAHQRRGADDRHHEAHLAVAGAPSPAGDLRLTLTLSDTPPPGTAELLDLAAVAAAAAAARLT